MRSGGKELVGVLQSRLDWVNQKYQWHWNITQTD